MSLYHEAAAALTAPAAEGGNLKTRIFGPRSGAGSLRKKGGDRSSNTDTSTNVKPKSTASSPAQVYALAMETAKWSPVLSEVIDAADLLSLERRRLPSPASAVLALLLVHDLLLSRSGVRLPADHGLHAAVARHKARLTAELTRARLRRRAASLDELRVQVERAAAAAAATSAGGGAAATRWIRINTLRSSLTDQLATTFAGYRRVSSLPELWAADQKVDNENKYNYCSRRIYIDEHIPDLVAVPMPSPFSSSSSSFSSSSSSSSSFDLTKSEAYRSGAIIFQDKASCFPAYLLDPASVFGGVSDDSPVDLVDACAAPGNKTSHLAALTRPLLPPSSSSSSSSPRPCIFAFEKDPRRSKTLQSMLRTAGALDMTTVGAGQDFLLVDPTAACYRNIRALLLDPSCSGSGIVGRDDMPVLHLPRDPAEAAASASASAATTQPKRGSKKRKRPEGKQTDRKQPDDKAAAAAAAAVTSITATTADTAPDADAARLTALAAFQLTLLLHAFAFPAARRITYSTCSVHAEENEQVVVRALAAAKSSKSASSGWRLLRRDEQVAGMRAWPVRGVPAAARNAPGVDDSTIDADAVADACIRSYPDDTEHGVMGFFVAAFVRDDGAAPPYPPPATAPTDEPDDDSEWSGFDD